ncbi:MAG: 1-acyl-sn-glycerol-3-phosphate acyltransferase [Bacteroidota bacterium]|nr:1-acyl-sn-glycerol-3-phosphate acyltransferase [Bacteroidota bacterium]
MAKTRPILTPPVQVSHLYYRLTRPSVWSGITRYFRIRGLDGFDALPKPGTPAIFISNHQNGMMDPMPTCAFIPQQIHYLTRADVFWNPVFRHVLYGYNQQPIYRQRDKLADLRHRNDIIFDVCVERLKAGAAMALFPEGNHNPFPSIRPMKGGLAEMLARAARKHESLRDIQVIPIGLDYEHYADWRRQLRVRAGKPIPYADCLNEDGTMDKVTFHDRVTKALKQVAVDIQPAEAQQVFHDGIRAKRTTELDAQDWEAIPVLLEAWRQRWSEDPAWAARVSEAHRTWNDAHQASLAPGRPEAWGQGPEDVRVCRAWVRLLDPFARLAQLPTWPIAALIRQRVKKKVRKLEFVSTMRMGFAMVLFPTVWLIESAVAGALAPEGWGVVAAAGMWVWGNVGSRLFGRFNDAMHTLRDAEDGRAFWHDPQHSDVREAWKNYLEALK